MRGGVNPPEDKKNPGTNQDEPEGTGIFLCIRTECILIRC